MKYILFDLDGTLLPMDNDVFTKAYFKDLAAFMYPHGYETQGLIKAVWHGMSSMVNNDGSRTNEEAFWESFDSDYQGKALKDKPVFDEFYRTSFNSASKVCSVDPLANETIRLIKELELKTAVATLPVFPAAATEARIRWAGLEVSDFEFYTSYENCRYCKPNAGYFKELLEKLGCSADECLMVGNNVDEDMCAQDAGMKVFLLTNCLINESNKDISVYPHGSFKELMEYIRNEVRCQGKEACGLQ